MQINKQTTDEKIAMYMALPQEDIVKMLVECNRLLDNFSKNSLAETFEEIKIETENLSVCVNCNGSGKIGSLDINIDCYKCAGTGKNYYGNR